MKIIASLLAFVFMCQLSSAQKTIESHMMGHSLIDHASATQQTKIAYWIYELATDTTNIYESTGQFGSIWDFANFVPSSQWGIPGNPTSWDEEMETYAEADLNNFIFTIFNFVQDLPPTDNYGSDTSVLHASERLVDSVKLYQPSNDIFLYENWPDMAAYALGDPFNPTEMEFAAYHAYTLGAFHNWWIDLHDLLLASKPTYNIRMIPVGPMISELLLVAPYDTISPVDLYEDNSPHGRETIYFLAGLATYMAIYGEKAPASYSPPATILPAIADNYTDIVDDFWDYMVAFDDASGNNRVFVNVNPPNDADSDGIVDSLDNCINIANPDQADYDNDGIGDVCDTPEDMVIVETGVLYQDNAEGILLKGRDGNCYLLFVNNSGILTTEQRPCPE